MRVTAVVLESSPPRTLHTECRSRLSPPCELDPAAARSEWASRAGPPAFTTDRGAITTRERLYSGQVQPHEGIGTIGTVRPPGNRSPPESGDEKVIANAPSLPATDGGRDEWKYIVVEIGGPPIIPAMLESKPRRRRLRARSFASLHLR